MDVYVFKIIENRIKSSVREGWSESQKTRYRDTSYLKSSFIEYFKKGKNIILNKGKSILYKNNSKAIY